MTKKITFLFALCISLNTFSQVEKAEEVIKISEGNVAELIPIQYVEDPPIYPGCEDFTPDHERKRCMTQNLRMFVNENFNMDMITKLDIPSGRHRIIMSFTINEKGDVENPDARAPHPDLKAEAIRVLSLIPSMTPGKNKGQSVPVLQTLPLMIMIQGGNKNTPKRG